MDRLLEDFVSEAREAAADTKPARAMLPVLERALVNRDAFASLIAAQTEDEDHLFEDDTVSIWTCRFQPRILIPPHEHRLPVHIAVVGGIEQNILYQRRHGELYEAAAKDVRAGEILSLGAEAVHGVTAAGEEPSLALHVYLGPLMQTERSLFNWRTGEPVPFTMENLEAMKRPARH